jgi:glycosyltransferase involved in cell wall biosynthesis
MITIIVPARNARDWTERALLTLLHSIDRLQWRGQVHFILLDDASDPDSGVREVFSRFRQNSGLPARIVRFKQRQHYCGVFAAGLSLSQGEKVYFVSNDMVFTPDFLAKLHDVSNLDPAIGIVRGTSNYTDSHDEHTVQPPFSLRSFEDVLNFSHFVALHWQNHYVADRLLSGDAILINRPLIDRIGVVDTRYFGYFGDIDYGLRALRAGFRLVCAKGAWLFHEGAGHVKDEGARPQADRVALQARRMELVQKAYELFREKWDMDLPEKYSEVRSTAFPHLSTRQPLDLHRYVPPLTLTPELADFP